MAKLFIRSPRFVENAFVGPNSLLATFSAHAEAWRSAADGIVEQALAEGSRGRLDYYFPVICYLYRHYVELELKVLIRLAARVVGRPLPPKLSNTHSLESLLDMLKRLLASAGMTTGITRGVGTMLRELHLLDPDGQRFRYLTKQDDTVAIPDLYVNVRHLRKQMGTVWKNLIGVEGWLDDLASQESE